MSRARTRSGGSQADLIAGLVLAAILVPQGMAYAELAGLPAVTGLYTTIACLVAYAVFGPSRILVLGPDSSVSPMIFAAIVPLMATDDPATAIALAGMLALLVGGISIALGIGKLGFVADLLSSEVQVGYMNGLAITIIVGQLPKLFGFSTDADGFVEEIEEFFAASTAPTPRHSSSGCPCSSCCWSCPDWCPVSPRSSSRSSAPRWCQRCSTWPPTASRRWGPSPGHARPSVPWTQTSDVGPLFVAAMGITLVSLTDTIATATSFAARRGEEVDPDQEMIGIGAANVAAGLFQGFSISTSGSRTAVAEQSGAKSQLTGVVGAGLVVVLLLFLNSCSPTSPRPRSPRSSSPRRCR